MKALMNDTAQNRGDLTIGGLAKAADVNVETIRYYERIGLIEKPSKPGQGFRKYPPQAVQNIRFIKRAKELGFSLQEISDLLLLGDGCCKDVRQRAEAKRARVDSQIADLTELRDVLDGLISACQQSDDDHNCPIVETLLGERTDTEYEDTVRNND